MNGERKRDTEANISRGMQQWIPCSQKAEAWSFSMTMSMMSSPRSLPKSRDSLLNLDGVKQEDSYVMEGGVCLFCHVRKGSEAAGE